MLKVSTLTFNFADDVNQVEDAHNEQNDNMLYNEKIGGGETEIKKRIFNAQPEQKTKRNRNKQIPITLLKIKIYSQLSNFK